MNLTMLRRYVADTDVSESAFRYLLGCRGECEYLDYKESLSLQHPREIGDFARDVLAMKNVGGGYLLVGVADKTWSPVGLPGAFPYDSKQLKDKLRSATGLELDIDVVEHYTDQKRFALIHVRKRKRLRVPLIPTRDFDPAKPYGFKRGEIFVREGDSTVRVSSAEALEDLIEAIRAHEAQEQQDEQARVSPFAVVDGTYRLLEKGFGRFVGRSQLRERLVDAIRSDPRIWIVNVHGPGGVGKSAIVNWAVYELYEKRAFESIIQLTAKETSLASGAIQPVSRSLYSLDNLLDHILETFEESTHRPLEEKRRVATDILSAWSTLLVLDNMETVSDGRILDFVQRLPPTAIAKVVLTSRQKTGGWELPLPVSELSEVEVAEFVKVKSVELGIDFPSDPDVIRRTWEASGGLPLAIQWIMGQYKRSHSVRASLGAVADRDSPVLEFSFRNIWNTLSSDARVVLATLTIFDGPPSHDQLSIATEWSHERVERAVAELVDVTLVNRVVQQSDGREVFTSLPITLSFSRHQLAAFGDFELQARQRIQTFANQMRLHEAEVREFKNLFDRFGVESGNEKRAVILCKKAESDAFLGNAESAERLFAEARKVAPHNAYVLAMSANFALSRNHVGEAKEFIRDAQVRVKNRRTGSFVFGVKARISDATRDRLGTVEALKEALKCDPDDVYIRHRLGVALSRMGRPEQAIEEFDTIIRAEESRTPLRPAILAAIKCRIINLRRLNRDVEAKTDLDRAKRILRDNPHLESQVGEIDELE